MRGDATLFTRNDEVEAQWRICDPIVHAWARTPGPLPQYEAGSQGPEDANQRLHARATIAADEDPAPGQLALLRETVILQIGDRHLDDLLTIADPLVVTDMPTLLWSPHGHPDVVDTLLALAQSVLLDSVDEPVWREAIGRACALTTRAYVVDL